MIDDEKIVETKEKKKKSDKFVLGFSLYVLGLILVTVFTMLVLVDLYIIDFMSAKITNIITLFIFIFHLNFIAFVVGICKDELSKKAFYLMWICAIIFFCILFAIVYGF